MSVLELPAYSYHADLVDDQRPSLSASLISVIVDKSPAHARAAHPRLNPDVSVDAKTEFDVGTAAHALLLGGMEAVQVLEFDNWTTKAARAARDEARAHGFTPLLEKQWVEVEAMTDAMSAQLDRYEPRPFTDGAAEQTLVWEERGVLCRARLDWLREDGGIDDYKTASSADPQVWSRRMVDHGCHIQEAWYRRGVRAVIGRDEPFRFVVVEKTAPYALSVFQVAPDLRELAERQIDWALDMWAGCLAADTWPAYTDGRVCWVNAEPWHEAQWLNREARVAA